MLQESAAVISWPDVTESAYPAETNQCVWTSAGPVIALSVEKCDAQAGCEDQLVLFLAGRRVRNVGVSKVILPSQPFDDLGYDAEIEIDSIVKWLG